MEDRRLVIHHPACKQILGIKEFMGRFKDCTDFTIEKLLELSVKSAGAPPCCGNKWRSTFVCLALLEKKLDSNPELTTMMFLTDQFASLAKLSGEEIWYENTGHYLKDLGGKFGKLLAILKDMKGLSDLDCVIDDDFSHWYIPTDDKSTAASLDDNSKITFMEEDFKDAPIEYEDYEASAGSKRLKSFDVAQAQANEALGVAADLAEAQANAALMTVLQSLGSKKMNE